jgi:hypothetical protein
MRLSFKPPHLARHSGGSRNPAREAQGKNWIPAFAGMTHLGPVITTIDDLGMPGQAGQLREQG